MSLILRVQTYRNQPLPAELSCRFEEGGTVGRAPGNGLVLDDPGKFISRSHAAVSLRAGQYYLTDTGSNPSIVNDRPLGAGCEIALGDGDRIVIGDYLLQATLETEASGDAPAAPAPPAAPPAPPAAEPLPLPLFVPPPQAPAPPLPPLEAPAPAAAVVDRAFDASLPDALAGASILASGPAFGAGPALSDPLGLNLFAGQFGAPLQGADGDGAGRLAPGFRGTESDHVPPELHAFSMPAPVAIPADYDPLADVLAPAPTPVPLAGVRTAERPAPPPAAAADPSPQMRAPAQPPLSAPASPAADSVVLQALLAGLGLPQLHTTRTPEQLARLVGEMLRAATAGTMEVLMARALTKRESHIDMTMIAPRANNPLKFFPDPTSALTQMLGAQAPGYLPPVQAIDGAFDDLKAHELAVIAGMRAALAGVVQRFDPGRIEQRMAEPGRLDKLMPGGRKARMWDRLVELYGELARDADEELQRRFGETFSEAYEEQVERLRAERH